MRIDQQFNIIIQLSPGQVMQRRVECGIYPSGEHASEGVEPSLVGCGHHLGDVHHEGSEGIAVLEDKYSNYNQIHKRMRQLKNVDEPEKTEY